MSGQRVGGRPPTPPDIIERIRELAAAGTPDTEIAPAIGYSARQVLRIRQAAGIEPGWVPPARSGVHGTPSTYRHGCRCAVCRQANTDRARAYYAIRQGPRP